MRSWNDISQFYHTDIWQWAWLSSSSVPLPFFGFKSFISSCSTIPILSTRNQHKTFLIKLFIYFPNQIIVYHFPSTSVSKEGGQNNLQLLSITLQGLCPLYTISSSLLVSLCDNESSLVEELYSFSLAGFFFSTASRIISGFSPIYLNTSAFQIGFLKWSDMNCTPQTLSSRFSTDTFLIAFVKLLLLLIFVLLSQMFLLLFYSSLFFLFSLQTRYIFWR